MSLSLFPRFAPLLLLVGWGALIDLRERRLPNWLTLLILTGGLAQSCCAAGTVRPAASVLGVLAGGAIPFLLFAIGAVGAGDVKLMAGIGAWLGPGPVLLVLMFEKLIGLALVLGQAAAQRRTALLMRNSAVLAVNLLNVNQIGASRMRDAGQQFRSIDRPLPFAVPALLAVVLLVLRTGRAG